MTSKTKITIRYDKYLMVVEIDNVTIIGRVIVYPQIAFVNLDASVRFGNNWIVGLRHDGFEFAELKTKQDAIKVANTIEPYIENIDGVNSKGIFGKNYQTVVEELVKL